MSNKWNHSLCDECWYINFPDRIPVRVIDDKKRVCCCCGKDHQSGILIRAEPMNLPCRGEHE